MTPSSGHYLLSIEPIPSDASSDASPLQTPPFPAYFVGSTAPNNVEDPVNPVSDPSESIRKIAHYLKHKKNPELLIAVHGYNTALGDFATSANPSIQAAGVKGWYQDIRNHVAEHCTDCSKELVFVGYRWPSEQVKGIGNDTLGYKLGYAQKSLPVVLKVLVALAIAVLVGLSIVALKTDLPGSVGFGIVGFSFLILAIFVIAIVFTLFLLRIVGYFRDAYRATNFGVPDLVEFIRQLDKAVLDLNSDDNEASRDWSENRIKLSFIGHSMGAFVVTNTVRILSDVFDAQSIGTVDRINHEKHPSADVGNVFALGRLVLVSPDIPAETIISGRANFLSSSLRRFEETYLFSNEGDMALKLASTSANYSSFPTRTREGGYRLGNVVVRSPLTPKMEAASNAPQYGIVNLNPKNGELYYVTPREDGGVEPERMPVEGSETSEDPKPKTVSSFLKSLYILNSTSLADRQIDILGTEQKPIAELFTVFDCTDYQETIPNSQDGSSKKVGILSRALSKHSLNFWDYVTLSFDFFTGKIDTHGGYFCAGNADKAAGRVKPEARFSKQLIYGLACSGFKPILTQYRDDAQEPKAALQNFSKHCEEHSIQVLLAAERYNRDVLNIQPKPSDRAGY